MLCRVFQMAGKLAQKIKPDWLEKKQHVYADWSK